MRIEVWSIRTRKSRPTNERLCYNLPRDGSSGNLLNYSDSYRGSGHPVVARPARRFSISITRSCSITNATIKRIRRRSRESAPTYWILIDSRIVRFQLSILLRWTIKIKSNDRRREAKGREEESHYYRGYLREFATESLRVRCRCSHKQGAINLATKNAQYPPKAFCGDAPIGS